MERTFDLAITLKATPFEERNQIVTGLTENHGLVTVVAKNSVQSKRFGGALGLFLASTWGFELKPGRDLGTLLEATTRHAFDSIRADLFKLTAASMMSEALQKTLQPHHAAADLFRLLSNALFRLEELPSEDRKAMWGVCNGFWLKVLQWTGHPVQISECASCKKPMEAAIDEEVRGLPERGRWTCASCDVAGVDLPGSALVDLKVLQSLPIRKATEVLVEDVAGQKAIFRFLYQVAIYHVAGLDRSALKSVAVLESLDG